MNKKHMRRGQAAMEFLMTYGWAILVVLAAIGALAYFGVLSPDNFLPERCTISPEFGCLEHQVLADGTVSLGIQNNVGSTVSDLNVTLIDPATGSEFGAADQCSASVPDANTPNGQRFNNTAGNLVVINCEDGAGDSLVPASGDRFQADIEISYRESGSQLVHTRSGTLQSSVQ